VVRTAAPCYPDPMTPTSHYRYLYLHGFASSAAATKGTRFAEGFASRGLVLELPDLNRPSFASLDHDAILAHLATLSAGSVEDDRPLRLIGSSFGGWIAARFAELHPARVDRLLLLCPGFDMVARWPVLLGEHHMNRWRERGYLPFPDHTGAPVPVHWGFIEAALRHPASPAPACPIVIVHGTRDTTVPIDSSRTYVADHPTATLHEVDDDHGLIASLPAITAVAFDFFGIARE